MAGRNYSHDLNGALVQGYARRTREGIAKTIKNAAGWSRPMKPDVTLGARLGLGMFIEGMLRAAVEPEVIKSALERELADLERTVEDAKRDRPLRGTEDPFDHLGKMPYDWSDYDAHVDQMSQTNLRSALKVEARLRAALQAELEKEL